MNIRVNGDEREVDENISVLDLLALLNYNRAKTAVWIDGRQLLLSEYDSYVLAQGCEVKLLRILGGG